MLALDGWFLAGHHSADIWVADAFATVLGLSVAIWLMRPADPERYRRHDPSAAAAPVSSTRVAADCRRPSADGPAGRWSRSRSHPPGASPL